MEKFYDENYDRLVPPGDARSRVGLPGPVETLIADLSRQDKWELVSWEVSGDDDAVEIRLLWKGQPEQRRACCIRCLSGDGRAAGNACQGQTKVTNHTRQGG